MNRRTICRFFSLSYGFKRLAWTFTHFEPETKSFLKRTAGILILIELLG